MRGYPRSPYDALVPAQRPPSLVPSALLSSRWSRDNLLTPEMKRLYTGKVLARLGVEELEERLAGISRQYGALEVDTGSLGVLSWNVRARLKGASTLLLVPLLSDEAGVGGRSKQTVPERCFENARHFLGRGLGRYLLAPQALFPLPGFGPAASFFLPEGPSALTFGLGSARVDRVDDDGAWLVRLGTAATADVTRELLAALAYHYDAEEGTSIADVLINDGDFLVGRDTDGSFRLLLTCARRIERGIGPDRFLLYLIQLMAYEDWNVDDDLVGLPVPISDPSLAFSGFLRGTKRRYLDLGQSELAGEEAALGIIRAFGESREGRAYLPWIEQFLADPAGGGVSLGDDPRRPWWNLTELEQRRDLLRLQRGDEAAEPLTRLIAGLEAAIGVGPEASSGDGKLFVNDVDRGVLLELFSELGWSPEAQATAAAAWFSGWPYRNRGQLRRQLPQLVPLLGERKLEFSIAPGDEEGTLAALARLPTQRPLRPLANPEIYGEIRLEADQARAAALLLPTFEAFQDDVLHDPRFGYYANRVVIGRGGHFSTHPEDLSPHYGRWVASWAFEVRRQLLEQGRLAAGDPFPLIEFGAGNGRLARDLIDAVRSKGKTDPAWQSFGQCLDYRIYELSDALRKKQGELLGEDARTVAGDARHPAACLERDFPRGVVGLVVSNELPDAFGVHKVVLSAEGDAHAVLVLPRLRDSLLPKLSSALGAQCRAADTRLRQVLQRDPQGELLLDRTALCDVLAVCSEYPEPERTSLVDGLWFEELLVPAALFQRLSEVLRAGAAEYARALAEEDSGVVVYVNVHGVTFVRELASVLSAGQVLTIDYGDTTLGLVQGARRGKFPLRIYCDEGDYEARPNHPYTRPGSQDLTADVNFTDLGLAGLEGKLAVSYYGPERVLAGKELPLVLASTEQQPFASFAGNTVFKVLALGRDVDFAPRASGLEPSPLFSAELPIDAASRERLAHVYERLRQLGTD